jgi:uncharacterized protein (DUF983 family)
VREARLSISEALRRCLGLRCPACGKSSIAKKPFDIKELCSSCAVVFKREEGFFVGAILINVVATELVILATYLTCLGVIGSHYQMVLAILFAIALLFPIAFYHHSWSILLAFDHFVESLPKSSGN